MRSLRDIKKCVSHAGIRSSPQADKAMLGDLIQELEKATEDASIHLKPRDWAIAARIVAAAAIVIITLIVVSRPSREIVREPRVDRPQSAADLLTVGCLNAACRRGGPEAIDHQCEEAARRLENRPEKVSVKELIRELKGI